MKFSKKTQPRNLQPFRLLILILFLGGAVVLAFAGLIAWRANAGGPGAPTAIVINYRTAAYTESVSATLESAATSTPATLSAMIKTTLTAMPTPAPTDTPAPTLKPTGYYAAPANPTPIPTPVLPPAAPFPTSCDGPGRINILVIGMDGRSANYNRAARADALAVVGVSFGDRTAQILSIPRDLWVQIPEHGGAAGHENRINLAYSLGQQYNYPGGGPAFQALVVSNTFGLRIDRTVVLNFTAFETAVDTMGGIDIDVPRAIHDTAYPDDEGGTLVLEIPAGLVHMDGRTALMYARTRHQDNDFGRMWRQQQVVMAMRDKLFSPESITALPGLAQILYNSVRTDLSLEEVSLLGCVGPQIPREAISRIVMDAKLVEALTTETGAQVLRPKMDAILPLLEVFSTGQ
jgi:LCP family protein required for cell wall assembly